MAQEQFAGPDHYTEFDPEKFIRDLKIQRDAESDTHADTHTEEDTAAASDDASRTGHVYAGENRTR